MQQAQLPLRVGYKHRSYDALATCVLLSDSEKEIEMSRVDQEPSVHPDNFRKWSLLALCCFCPVGVKALSHSLTVSAA